MTSPTNEKCESTPGAMRTGAANNDANMRKSTITTPAATPLEGCEEDDEGARSPSSGGWAQEGEWNAAMPGGLQEWDDGEVEGDMMKNAGLNVPLSGCGAQDQHGDIGLDDRFSTRLG